MADTDGLLELYLAEVRRLALDDDAQRPLWFAYKRRPTVQIRRRLWDANLYKIARIVLKRFQGVGPELALDMIQDAAVEVLPYLDRYRPEDGVPFGAYIHKSVLTYATRTFRRLSTPVKFAHTHREVAVPDTSGLDEVLALSADAESPEAEVLAAELACHDRAAIERAMAEMDEQERFVFREHALSGRSLNDIAAELGISRKWAQPIWNRAVETARQWVGAMAATA